MIIVIVAVVMPGIRLQCTRISTASFQERTVGSERFTSSSFGLLDNLDETNSDQHFCGTSNFIPKLKIKLRTLTNEI